MPATQLQRYEQILIRMISRVVSRTDLSDIVNTSSFKHALAAAAREMDEIYYQMDRQKDLWSIDKAKGDDLDERAKDIQPATLVRLAARKAITTVQFTRTGTTGDVTIPSGTILKTSTGITYATDIQAQILNTATTSNVVGATAQEAGVNGNIDSGALSSFGAKVPGVDAVSNTTGGIQGRDKESDDAFKERLKAFVQSLPRCNVSAQEFAVLGVQDASGKEVVFSHLFEDPVDPSIGTLYVDDGLGTAESTESRSGSITVTDNFVEAAGTVTLTVADGNFTEALVGDDIIIANATTANNNGTFPITAITSDTEIQYTNTNPGFTEVGNASAGWAISEVVISSALGGEEFLYTDKFPIKSEVAVTVTKDPLVGPDVVLTLGSNYWMNAAVGRLYFAPALAAGDKISIAGNTSTPTGYTYFTGLLAAAQKVIDGDENDRDNYPGYRAAGTIIRCLSPTVVSITVGATLSFLAGYTTSTVITNVENAILDYINNLGISGDVIRNEIIERIMSVEGTLDCVLTTPVTNTTILDDEIARATTASVTVS